jgi:hypothetical protein
VEEKAHCNRSKGEIGPCPCYLFVSSSIQRLLPQLFYTVFLLSVRRFTDYGCPIGIFTLFLYIDEHVLFLNMYQLFTTGRYKNPTINQSTKQDGS